MVMHFSPDLLVMGFCWFEPLANWKKASAWGIWGGICALINPIVAMIWGLLSLQIAYVNRSWLRFGLAVLLAGGTLVPWTVRNYQVFGRIIPVRSNLAFESYQSQCLLPTGLPYIAISYYDRYALPLLGVKVLLVIWAADRLLSFLQPVQRESSSRNPKPPSLVEQPRGLHVRLFLLARGEATNLK